MLRASPLISAGGVLALALLSGCGSKTKDAQSAETRGDYQTAVDLYSAELGARAAKMKYPNRNEAKFLKAEEYQRIVGDYLGWVAPLSPVAPVPEAEAALQGIERCIPRLDSSNYLIELKTKTAAPDSVRNRLVDAFFPPASAPTAAAETMAGEAISRAVSIFTIQSTPRFSYEGRLVERATGRVTDFFLYADNHISLLLRPGAWYLICRATKNFKANEVWLGPTSVTPLTIPEQASLMSCKIMTRVKRPGQ